MLKEKAYVLLSKTQRHFIMVECSPNFYLCLSDLIENVVTLGDYYYYFFERSGYHITQDTSLDKTDSSAGGEYNPKEKSSKLFYIGMQPSELPC